MIKIKKYFIEVVVEGDVVFFDAVVFYMEVYDEVGFSVFCDEKPNYSDCAE